MTRIYILSMQAHSLEKEFCFPTVPATSASPETTIGAPTESIRLTAFRLSKITITGST